MRLFGSFYLRIFIFISVVVFMLISLYISIGYFYNYVWDRRLPAFEEKLSFYTIQIMYRILQIEDLPSDAYLIKREVKKVLGPCEFQIVEEKEAFLKALIEFKPDIIISDFSMPGFDWHSAFNLTMKYASRIPFIVVSGSTSDEISNECLKAGATDFISKNSIQKLGPVIIKALQHNAHLPGC
jgi:CheY-like chemotaxis protein